MELKPLAKPIFVNMDTNRLLLVVVAVALVLGTLTGYILSSKSSSSNQNLAGSLTGKPKTAGQDAKTFRDFAEGTMQVRPVPKDPTEYVEGTHLLMRKGAVPVALTSSVVDLSLYEGKKVKVYGETQKALKEGWLMDVGKVEEIK